MTRRQQLSINHTVIRWEGGKDQQAEVCVCERERERDRQTDRQTETERQRDSAKLGLRPWLP